MLNNLCIVLGRRLFEDDRPLTVILEGSVAGRNSKLVLRDNLCSTIQWDAFSYPELQNFISILQREEEIYASRVSGCGYHAPYLLLLYYHFPSLFYFLFFFVFLVNRLFFGLEKMYSRRIGSKGGGTYGETNRKWSPSESISTCTIS